VALSGKVTRLVAPASPTSESTATISAPGTSARRRSRPLTIERAIQSYLQAQRTARHRPKTLEWHQAALHQLHHYLLAERHLLYVGQITEIDIRAWIVSLSHTPTPAGRERAASTIATYTRSARAFCTWLVHQEVLPCSPMSEDMVPRSSVPLPHIVSPERFEQFVQASGLSPSKTPTAKRDRALLWVLFETGITLSELCGLHRADVDLTTGILSVRGKGGTIRQMTLGAPCLRHLLAYLDQVSPAKTNHVARRKTGDDPLFVSELDHALTKSSLSSLLSRLRTRAGSTALAITPQHLRHSFALRYLQAGGDPQNLQALMGYEGMAPIRQDLRWHDQLLHNRIQDEAEQT